MRSGKFGNLAGVFGTSRRSAKLHVGFVRSRPSGKVTKRADVSTVALKVGRAARAMPCAQAGADNVNALAFPFGDSLPHANGAPLVTSANLVAIQTEADQARRAFKGKARPVAPVLPPGKLAIYHDKRTRNAAGVLGVWTA